MITLYNTTEKTLINELDFMIQKYGFASILSMLEVLASNNADIGGNYWEIIRQNLENSVLEIEEHAISSEVN